METLKDILKDLKLVNHKNFKGHEGMQGLNADIVYKGQKILHVYDDARGGEFEYTTLGYDTPKWDSNKALVKELEGRIDKLPMDNTRYDFEFKVNLDTVVGDLEQVLSLKKDEKKGIVFHEKDKKWSVQIMGYSVQIPTLLKDSKNKDHYISELQKDLDKLIKKDAVILNKEYLQSVGLQF